MRPALIAAMDQVAAGLAEADRLMVALAAHNGSTPQLTNGRSEPMRRVLTKLIRRAANNDLGQCPHVSGSAPVHWAAWAPGRVRCRDCLIAACGRIRGTKEDRRCDACRRYGRRIHPDVVQLPSLVVDLDHEQPPLIVPVVLAHFGLCPSCHAIATATR